MGTVTLGVSIAVPEPYGSFLQRQREGFGDPAAPGIPTHITLLPPTEVSAGALPGIERHLAEVAAGFRPFPLRLEGTGTFRPLSPVVYVKVTEGEAGCTALQARIRAASGPCARELQFPYHPHVTVAHNIADADMDRAQAGLRDFCATWTIGGFALYEQGADEVWRLEREFPFPRQTAGVPRQAADLSRPPAPSC
ncbi:2'-5' RNA ligase family protein [Streptomyces sioyaensis]|uniref:2'-5' RNA ligase family protein n=1 Tax=Streptomyces sioyaensis TaxID=67364 RepID=UPI001F225CE0|nr:2'-5' RNA ligase family protein [Streptomyces sioyaensis]MCF3177448.1 2'-5' RNA ligase family protein [Streptomyces sioyaensis]